VIWKEYKVIYICDLMANIVTATQRHAEKQQTRTAEEKEAELREEEYGVLPVAHGAAEDVANEDDDDGPIYNPLNLPLGWDGKPIPFWLYKLHGLGVEYKCEICGNQSYWGRKAFDRHFQEWKHAHGMRCLGKRLLDIDMTCPHQAYDAFNTRLICCRHPEYEAFPRHHDYRGCSSTLL